MEQITDYSQPVPATNLFDLQIDNQSSSFLSETARWSKFLAIVGFIFLGLFSIAAIILVFAGSMLGALLGPQFGAFGGVLGGAFIGIFFLGIIALYFFPTYYLYNFASKMKLALANNDQVLLNTSFRNLKSCFKFVGILTLIGLSIYALVFVFSIIGMIFR